MLGSGSHPLGPVSDVCRQLGGESAQAGSKKLRIQPDTAMMLPEISHFVIPGAGHDVGYTAAIGGPVLVLRTGPWLLSTPMQQVFNSFWVKWIKQ